MATVSGGTARDRDGPSTGAARRRLRLVGLLLAPLALTGLAVLLGFAGFLLSLEQVEREPSSSGDGIVVLTGGAQRIEDAIELLAKGFGSRLLITGVNERTSRETIARLSPGQGDLVACCVDLDYRARNTVGNAAEIARWVRSRNFGSLIVVTSNYHLPRALAELDEALPEIRKVPYAVVTAGRQEGGFWPSVARTRLLASEYLKYLAVSVRTRVAGWWIPQARASRSTAGPDREGGRMPARAADSGGRGSERESRWSSSGPTSSTSPSTSTS